MKGTWEHKQEDLWQTDRVCAAKARACSRETAMLPALVMQTQSRTPVQCAFTCITQDMLISSKSAFKRRLFFSFTMAFLCQYTFKIYKYLKHKVITFPHQSWSIELYVVSNNSQYAIMPYRICTLESLQIKAPRVII